MAKNFLHREEKQFNVYYTAVWVMGDFLNEIHPPLCIIIGRL